MSDTRITKFFVKTNLAERHKWLIERGWSPHGAGSYWRHSRTGSKLLTAVEAITLELGDDGI